MRGVLIGTNCSGRLCNRIVTFIHDLAMAIDAGRNFVYVFGRDIYEFSDLHPESVPSLSVRVLPLARSRIVDWVNGRLEAWWFKSKAGNLKSMQRVKAYGRRSRIFPVWVPDWYFRNSAGVVRHRDMICRFLRAKEDDIQRANKIVSRAHVQGALAIGVHVRRGDYRTAFGGAYCYSDEVYAALMEQCQSIWREQPICFFVVSNEPMNTRVYAERGLDVSVVSGTPVEDIVLLASCDYIVGPPSTFSYFASYYGNVPRAVIGNAQQKLSDLSFVRQWEQIEDA